MLQILFGVFIMDGLERCNVVVVVIII